MKIPLLVLTDFLTILWQGFVFSKLWAWFMVPIFGLPLVNLPQSIGILLIGGLMSYQFIPREEKELPAMIFSQLFMPLFGLIVGYTCS